MKFARYLESTQIPEWQRDYIDFKGLKKQIAGIRTAHQSAVIHRHGTHRHELPLYPPKPNVIGPLDEAPVYRITLPHRHSLHGIPGRAPGDQYPSMRSLYASLNTMESSFFARLDYELEKVDAFYIKQENLVVAKLSSLKDQLHELEEQRRLIYTAKGTAKTPRDSMSMLPRALNGFRLSVGQNFGHQKFPGKNNQVSTETAQSRSLDGSSIDPFEYQDAQRKLKQTIQEFYRHLERLKDYRVQNLTGFRKALKKFEKVTRLPVQDVYMREKIQPRRFAFEGTMDYLIREVENLFVENFANGDRKKARRHLNSPVLQNFHHFSTFRSGFFIGASLPVLAMGIHKSLQPEIHILIPEWATLLEVYAGLFIPVIFSLLVGINLVVWSRARINFAFIFELDVRTAIDTYKYFELPTIMFATLSYSLWLSFLGSGHRFIAPTTWPAIWTGAVIAILINPMPILSRSSRYWFLKNTFRLLISWKSHVEFTQFWLADQFCSLTYTLAEFYTIVCAFSNKWSNIWGSCSSPQHYAGPLVLVALPSFIRMAQSIRRYYDSRVLHHLINAGKYLTSMITFVIYYVWRARGSKYDGTFVLWCLFATTSSAYSSAWDILKDWSLISHRFLRPELVYSDNPWLYYFAIISNILIRFTWIVYIPSAGVSRQVRSFIVAILEMFRRFQWNFHRLENENLGNSDQYRVTGEVPMPFSPRR